MIFYLLAVVPAAFLTAMYLYERRETPLPLSAKAARSTLANAIRGRR